MAPHFTIHGVIGEGDNTARTVGSFLTEHAGEPVQITVNSPGGIATEGAAILAEIELHGRVTARIEGIAASAASLAAIGARHITMHHAALMMIHDPLALTIGTADGLRDEADNLDKMAELYAEAYSRHTGHPVARIRRWMKHETWMAPDEALALNFCDEIAESEPATAIAAFDYTQFQSAPADLVKLTARNGWTHEMEKV